MGGWSSVPQTVLVVLVLAVTPGCSGDESGDGLPPPRRQSETAPRGSVAGFVRLDGDERPAPTRVENTTDPEVCGREQTLDDLVVSAKDRGIQNVVLSLDGVPRDAWPDVEPGHLVIDNADCRFVPHTAVVTTGSTIEARNADPILHTTHFYGAFEANLSLPVQGAKSVRTVDTSGMIIVKCDVHGWMQAFVRVDPHPFHAVSDGAGFFRIDDVPGGTYTLEIWHERLGAQHRPIVVRPGETASVDIVYSLDDG